MTPDQYRREGAEAMRVAAADMIEEECSFMSQHGMAQAIRAIDVDGVLVKVGGEIDRRDHLVNGPARLWMHEGSSAQWFVKPAGNSTEYVRADLVDELRLIGCHANGDARCTCVIGQEAADALEAQAEETRRLREALALLTARAGSLVFAHHHGNGLEGWHKVIEGVDCALTQARAALSSTGEKG